MRSQNETYFSSTERENLLKDFENYLRGEGQRLQTVTGNVSIAGQFINWLQQEGIHYTKAGYSDLLAYINHNKARGNTSRTINQKLIGLKHFYNHLQGSGKVSYNPCQELRIKGVIKRQPHDLLEWEELEILYKNYPTQNITGKRNKVILGMMIYQGLNSGEVAKLEVTDVKLEEGKVYVPSVSRSNSRRLKLESMQILQLQKYITRVRPIILALKGDDYQSDSLFISTGEGHQLHNSLSRLMKKARKVNPKVKHPGQIRASVITHWLTKYNIRQVQYMSGHRYVSSTEKYRTDFLETLQEQIDELHPLK